MERDTRASLPVAARRPFVIVLPDSHRRRLLAAASASLLSACHTVQGERVPGDDVGSFRLTADFEPQAAIWLGWDNGHETLTLDLAQALQPFVPLRLLVRDDTMVDAARSALQRRGLGHDTIRFMRDPLASYFVRDSAVFAVGAGARLGVIDFRWSQYGLAAWCRHRHAGEPARLAACSAAVETERDGLDRAIAAHTGARLFTSRLAMEGGGVECNGRGLLIANEALWLSRNPGLDRAAIEAELLRLPGLRKVLWVPEGLAQDPLHRSTIVGHHVSWGTGGHTDEFVRFADARTVLLAWPEDSEAAVHPVARLNRQRMQRCFDVLSAATDADGQPLRVLKVPLPKVIERRVFLSAAADVAWSKEWTADFFPPSEKRRQGDPVLQVASSSYLNFVVANGVVVLPDYRPHGTPKVWQDRVVRIFETAFPGRQLRFVDALGANWVGGGAHCATLSEPRVDGPA